MNPNQQLSTANTPPGQVESDKLERLLGSIGIPPRPSLLVDLDKELKKGDPDTRVVANLVGRDVGISAAILKSLNSPLFALRSKVTGIPHAIQLMGLKNVRSVVTGLVVRQSLGVGASFERFWDSAEKVASINAYLCSVLPRAPREEAYMFGLFRDCGIPLLMQRFPDYKETLKIAVADNRSLAEVEDERHGTSHTVVGYMVGRSWGLPDAVCDAIRHHHDMEMLEADEFNEPLTRTLVCVNFVAEHINDALLRMRQDPLWERYGGLVLDYLGISEAEYREIEDGVFEMCG
jgi:HD-like signal output (HDOD) protein